jgi:pyruvate kinase
MCLTRGALGILLTSIPPAEEIFQEMENKLKRIGAIKAGDSVVYTAGLPALEHATTNTVHVKVVD